MDKYEYKLKTDQMLELMKDGAYNKAAEIADAIDWKRVRNTSMLSTVSEIYEKSGDYRKSYEVLRTAYNRAEGSRKIVSQLCALALKTRNVDEAIDYYDDFVEIAPKDPNQYILKYQILRAQRAPIEQQIHALEEFKKAEYREEWAYELAKLYQEAGMTAECLEECDDLILWFSEGKYVYQAMELKMQYKPLTPFQQEKYDRRFEEQTTETAELPDLTQYKKAEEPEAEQVEEELEEKLAESETQIQEETGKRKIGNTMKLDEALKSLLNITIKSDESETEQQEDTEAFAEESAEQEEDLSELEAKIEAIESVADIDFAEKIAEEKKKEIAVDPDLEELRPEEEIEESEDTEEVVETEETESIDTEEVIETEEAESIETDAEIQEDVKPAEVQEDGDQIQGQMNFMDFLDDWGDPEEEEVLEIDEDEELIEDETEDVEEDDSEEFIEDIEDYDEEDSEDFIEDETEAFFEDDAEEYEEDEAEEFFEADTESEESIEEGESMEEKKKDTPILSEDIQRLIDEIEGNIPVEEATEEEFFDDFSEEYEEEYDDFSDEYEEEYEEEFVDEYEEEYEDDLSDEYEEEYDEELSDEYEDDYDDDFSEEYEEDADDLFGEYEEEHEDELISQTQFDEVDDREIPDEDEIDLLSATTPLSRKETAKMIATGKTAPLPLDEISDALSMSDTGFIVHARYDLKTQSGVGTRAGLTEEQKKLFSYFVPVRGMSEQLVDVLEQDKNCTNRKGTSSTGNLLIIGNKGNGKTVLAVDVVKAIQKQRKIRQGKVAIVTGDSLNKKKIGDIVGKLYGGALIIEKAGKMNEKTVTRLNKAMESDTGEMLIVLEDQRKPLDRLLSSNREFRRKFTSRLEVPVFINDELVTFGQTYAQENGYRIDEMGILALYSRIDSLQREDHAVTIAEVKEIMDEAMEHSKKASAKKLVKRVFGKNTDDSDRIILTEKDFNI